MLLPQFRRRLVLAIWGGLLLLLAWAALAPLTAARERVLTIPDGTAAALASGRGNDDVPNAITLTLGVQDVLVLDNQDHVSQLFGPVLIAPGERFRMPFEQPGVYPVAGSAWAGQRLTVTVVEWPSPGWERLRWRAAALVHGLRYLPRVPMVVAPRA